MSDTPGDDELMARIQAGDTGAFGELYDRFATRAYLVARSLCGDGRAEAAVRDAFVSVWQGRGTYRPPRDTIAAWLLDTVRLCAVAVDDAPPPALLARLPDTQREAIVLAFYGRLTHGEIARHLEVHPGVIKGRMRLGLRKLAVS
jgi:DNA-directed RNA polymerase specialized sigma24 family protein